MNIEKNVEMVAKEGIRLKDISVQKSLPLDTREKEGAKMESKNEIQTGKNFLKEIADLNGVEDVILLDNQGVVIESTNDNIQLIEFIGFAGGIGESLRDNLSVGGISHLTLKSKNDSQLAVIFVKDRFVGILVSNKFQIRTVIDRIQKITGEV